jgi:uncharacterized repeat protein (TIGR03803 family)
VGSSGFGTIELSKLACVVILFCVATIFTHTSQAQTFTRLVKFSGTDGQNPYFGALTQGLDGDFYGTTVFGGAADAGTIFKISSSGKLTSVYSFCSASPCGAQPYAGLLQTSNGNLYGTTYYGGADEYGTLFELTPQGQFTNLHSFCSETNCADGVYPAQAPIYTMNHSLYGVAFSEIYELSPSGIFSNPAVPTGMYRMIQASDGNFYGVGVGDQQKYAILELTKDGQLLTLYSFCELKGCPDGTEPTSLVQAANGSFYGTTTYGGKYDEGTVFEFSAASGHLRTLYSFCSQADCADGAVPYAGVIQGSDGNFYGTTTGGGAVTENGQPIPGSGTIFEITPAGVLTTLHVFCLQGGQCSDGVAPYDPLVQGTDGNFYGTTYGLENCPGNCGTVFQISTGLAPFVRANPNFAKTGGTVTILGNDLTGTTSVTFNGVASTFDVASPTYIKAEVPTGATTGTIEVTTPSGALSSAVVFQVLR